MRSALFRSLSITAFVIVLFARPAHATDRNDVELDAEERVVLESINRYRTSLGLAELTPVPLLNAVAFAHSVDMARRGYFGHIDPSGQSPFDRMARVGYDVDNEGENLAAGRPTGAGAFTQWRRSPSHDAAMRDPTYRAIGIGRVVMPGSRFGTYWTAVFGDEVRAIDFDLSSIPPVAVAPRGADDGPHASRASRTRPSAARVQRARRIATANRARRYAPVVHVTSARH